MTSPYQTAGVGLPSSNPYIPPLPPTAKYQYAYLRFIYSIRNVIFTTVTNLQSFNKLNSLQKSISRVDNQTESNTATNGSDRVPTPLNKTTNIISMILSFNYDTSTINNRVASIHSNIKLLDQKTVDGND
jgi:hypothetical protein